MQDEQTGAIPGAPPITLTDTACQTVRIEPGDEYVFFADVVSNIDYDTSETIQWRLGDQVITARSDNIPAGSTHTFQSFTQTWQETIDLVEPGRYTMTASLAVSDVVQEVQNLKWKDDQGDLITVEVTDENGQLPDKASISITDVTLDPSTPTAGGQMDVSITAKNVGDLSGSRSYDLEMGLKYTAWDVVATLNFSLNGGESQTKTVTVQIPEDWYDQGGAGLSIGSVSKNFSIDPPEINLTMENLSATSEVETINVSNDWVNNSSVGVTFTHNLTVTDSAGSTVVTDGQGVTLNAGERKTINMTVSVDVPEGQSENFEVCVDSQGVGPI